MFNDVCYKYLNKEYEILNGGLTNKVYRVRVNSKYYIIKELNDSKVLSDIELSEKIANVVFNNGINAVCAIKFNNNYIQSVNGKNILIYKYCDGKILLTKELTLDHVKKTANMLGKLHSIKVGDTIDEKVYSKIDYLKYYNMLKYNNEKWCKYFKDNIDKLIDLYDNVYSNYLKLSNQKSYVHKDYNRKNILWKEDIPYIIDWETATIGNPSIDFFNSAWFLTADVDYDKYYAFAKEYFSIFKLDDDIKVSAYAAIIEECNWLEFSLKRVLESNDEYEIKMGKESIESSLTEIINYYDKIPLMIEIINKI